MNASRALAIGQVALMVLVTAMVPVLICASVAYFGFPFGDLNLAAGAAVCALTLVLVLFQIPIMLRKLSAMVDPRPRASDEVCRSDAGNSDSLAHMSHELLTPLTLIIGHTELLLEESPASEGNDQHRHDLIQIRLAAGQLLVLVNDLLDVARVEAGAVRIRSDPVDLRSLLEAAVQALQGLAAEEGSELSLEVDDLPLLVGDPVRIKQIVSTLVSNALKATRGGQVTVLCSRPGDVVILEVVDTGAGLSRGNGLRLTITNKLVRAMGGTIEMRRVVGQGSTFRVSLPLPQVAEEDQGAQD